MTDKTNSHRIPLLIAGLEPRELAVIGGAADAGLTAFAQQVVMDWVELGNGVVVIWCGIGKDQHAPWPTEGSKVVQSHLSTPAIESLRDAISSNPRDLIVVFGVEQLVGSNGCRIDISAALRDLKTLACKHDAAILCLTEFHPASLPHGNLREANTQHADQVMGLYRRPESADHDNLCALQLRLFRVRNGPTGIVDLFLDRRTNAIESRGWSVTPGELSIA